MAPVLVMGRMDVNKSREALRICTRWLFDFSDKDVARIHASSPAGPFTWSGETHLETDADGPRASRRHRVEPSPTPSPNSRRRHLLARRPSRAGPRARSRSSERRRRTHLDVRSRVQRSCPMTVSGKQPLTVRRPRGRDVPCRGQLKKPKHAQEVLAAPEASEEEAPPAPRGQPQSCAEHCGCRAPRGPGRRSLQTPPQGHGPRVCRGSGRELGTWAGVSLDRKAGKQHRRPPVLLALSARGAPAEEADVPMRALAIGREFRCFGFALALYTLWTYPALRQARRPPR